MTVYAGLVDGRVLCLQCSDTIRDREELTKLGKGLHLMSICPRCLKGVMMRAVDYYASPLRNVYGVPTVGETNREIETGKDIVNQTESKGTVEDESGSTFEVEARKETKETE